MKAQPNELGDGYRTVAEQLWSGNLEVPQEQMANVIRLLVFEMNCLLDGGPRARKRLLEFHKHERDKRRYVIFADGVDCGFNNSRAMPGYVERIREQNPDAVILLHPLGGDLDFARADSCGEPAELHPEEWGKTEPRLVLATNEVTRVD